MTPTEQVPAATEASVRGHAAAFVREAKPGVDLLLLRSAPVWLGPPVLDVGGSKVRVVEGVSPLAILDAIYAEDGTWPIIALTSLTERELGQAVLQHADRRGVTRLDSWALVPGLFGVRRDDLDPRIQKELGKWAPELLLQHRPAAGWQAGRDGSVSYAYVVGVLVAAVLGIPATQVDAALVFETLDDFGARERWMELDPAVADALARAVGNVFGTHVRYALHIVRSGTAVAIPAFGLAADVLWPVDGSRVPGIALDARVRLEQQILKNLDAAAMRSLADAAVGTVLRLSTFEAERIDGILVQAEALLTDLGWGEGAAFSRHLPAGFAAGLGEIAERVREALEAPSSVTTASLDSAIRRAGSHDLAGRDHSRRELGTAQMAVRLVRWLHTEPKVESTFAGAVHLYLRTGGWVDRAFAAIWGGSAQPALAEAYRRLSVEVRSRRDLEDAQAANLLTAADSGDGQVIAIERMLDAIILPLAKSHPALLVVLDGMSVGTATAITQDIAAEGWIELVREPDRRRLAAIAALPTLTKYSRASLFAGELVAGTQALEKTRFTARTGGAVFHKDDLRSAAGHELPAELRQAMNDTGQRVVATVLNTIDDALAKADPGGTQWGLDTVQHLRALLNAAALAGRNVILTSDHGHVVERGGEFRPAEDGGARWRPFGGEPARDDELLVGGPRVLAPGGQVILARSEYLRYTAKAAGYHGGAALAELTIPIVVLRRATAAPPPGWVDSAPQAPEWWFESDPAQVTAAAAPAVPMKRRKTAADTPEQVSMFDLPVGVEDKVPAVTPRRLSEQLLSSARYAVQRKRLVRRALDDAVVAQIIDAADERDGRVNQDVLAGILGIPTSSFAATLSVLRRLLNTDGYEVVAMDADQVTVVIDRPLLCDQFSLT
ncbi:BREX-2 system phosphatase PglZ [Mycetocola sp. 2940]|uniref:BREX-2 system phosphatase PglZ n=1 Tax=Mycetocola sp. 2940 TaxID=3156452 RepID=UPI0033969848